jgi:hypothetical protein
VGSYYNSPSKNDNELDNSNRIQQLQIQINEIKQQYNDKKVNFIIGGDFNCKSSYWDSFCSKYVDGTGLHRGFG